MAKVRFPVDNVTNERTRTSVLSGYGIGLRGLQIKFAHFLNIFLLVKVLTCYFDRKERFVFVEKTIVDLKRKLKRNSYQEELRNEEAFLVKNRGVKHDFFNQLLPHVLAHVSLILETRSFVSKWVFLETYNKVTRKKPSAASKPSTYKTKPKNSRINWTAVKTEATFRVVAVSEDGIQRQR